MEWTANANEAVKLTLVRAKDDKESLAVEEPFNPAFTYPIYGEQETIYGYRDLSVDLRFASGSLATYLSITHSDKLAANTVDDVEGKLTPHLPPDLIRDEDAFLKRVEEDTTSFRPVGTKVATYTRRAESSKGKKRAADAVSPDDDDAVGYEVYHATWETPGFREFHRRMQLFILLYIEGGSFINEDEDKWEFVMLFEQRRRKDSARTPVYHFVGYSSLYPFFYWPDKVRLRLSQFVILPPFQKQGHGSQLYRAIYNYVLTQPNIAELTVEDPAEAFEDLRDKNDLEMLLANERFMGEATGSIPIAKVQSLATKKAVDDKTDEGRPAKKRKVVKKAARGGLRPPADKRWVEEWRVKLKMAGRQFQRLMEMLALRSLQSGDEKANRAYRLQVKERIFRFNFETLAQLEKEERLEKLEETFQNVREDYQRILGLLK
ncbi:histone acetyltransferase type B catalytic subunit [Exidia glandulosa HHB12029]|uniref:Histone acetyltransferase type B catalytic subunit n=1 Tax=Exidia glandulosa HHB12029 TaxID=1314781 RepID=A0A165GV83_EXIGL|nr:histone acetyltransferase type B catalytic subunit [Exidia glandulosa HHB12029]